MSESEVYDTILKNAMGKPCFIDFTGGILDQIGDDQMERIDDVAGAMLAEAIRSPVENVAKSEWKSRAEAELLLLGNPAADLDAFYDAVMAECKVEMGAYIIAKTMFKTDATPEQVLEQVEAELQSE